MLHAILYRHREIKDEILRRIKPTMIFRWEYCCFAGIAPQHPLFMIIVPEDSCTPLSELEHRLGYESQNEQDFYYSLHRVQALRQTLEQDHLFYSLVCQKKNRLYTCGGNELPQTRSDVLLQIKEKAERTCALDTPRITAFMDGARFYWSAGNLPMTVFMLHQVIELTFRMIQRVFGRSCRHTHLIRAHLNRCRMFTPHLCALFSTGSKVDQQLISLLSDAYLNVRYRESFTITYLQLATLFSRTERLLEITPKVIKAHLHELDDIIQHQQSEDRQTSPLSKNATNHQLL